MCIIALHPGIQSHWSAVLHKHTQIYTYHSLLQARMWTCQCKASITFLLHSINGMLMYTAHINDYDEREKNRHSSANVIIQNCNIYTYIYIIFFSCPEILLQNGIRYERVHFATLQLWLVLLLMIMLRLMLLLLLCCYTATMASNIEWRK